MATTLKDSLMNRMSIRKKRLKKKLVVIEALVFAIPFFVAIYVLNEAGFLPKVQAVHSVLLAMSLLVILGGLLIMRKVFDEFEMAAVVVRKAADDRDAPGSVHFQSDTAEIREISSVLARFVKELAERKRKIIDLDCELEDARAGLIHLDRISQIGMMSASVMHELNQPLNVIGLSAQSILIDAEEGIIPPLHPAVRERLSRIGGQIARAKKLSDRIMTFARHGEDFVDMKPLNISEPLEGALSLMGRDLRQCGIRIETEPAPGLPSGLPMVMADASLLEQVFLNLMANARDAMEERAMKILTIRALASEDGGVTVEFRDTGGGIPEEMRETIFKPFFTTKPAGRGTGLGLAISRRIIGGHGGELALDVDDGVGSAFRVKLPPTAKLLDEKAKLLEGRAE